MESPGLIKTRVYGSGAAAGVGSRAIETLCGFAQLWLLTSILGKAQFGRYVFALTIVQIVALLSASGFERLALFRLSRVDPEQGVARGRDVAGAILGWGIIVSLGLGAIVLGAGPLVSRFVEDPVLGWWLTSLAALVPATTALRILAAWHQARMRISRAIVLGRAVPAVITVAALAIVWGADLGRTGVAVAIVGGPLLAWLGWWMASPVSPLHLRGVLGRDDARYAMQTSGMAMAHRTLMQSDLLMLGILATPVTTAEYAVVLRLARLLANGLDLLRPVFVPRVGLLLKRGERDELHREFHQSRMLAALVAMALAVPVILLGEPVLALIGDYGGAYPILLVLLAAELAASLFGLGGIVLVMAGHSGWTLATSLVLLVGNIALNAVLIPIYGGMGAAIATLTAMVTVRACTALLVWRIERVPTLTIPVVGLLVVTVAVLLTGAWTDQPPGLLAAIGLVLLGVIALEQRETLRFLRRSLRQWASGAP